MQALVKKTAPTKWLITNMVVPNPGMEAGAGGVAELIQTHVIENV